VKLSRNLSGGGFEIQKWGSEKPKILFSIFSGGFGKNPLTKNGCIFSCDFDKGEI
jgi:hypothetical protein